MNSIRRRQPTSLLSEPTHLLAPAFVTWALCPAMMVTGMAVRTEQTAIIVHAVAAPIIFVGISLRFVDTSDRFVPGISPSAVAAERT